jgi:rhodanese-related sulfurtransferase
MRFKATKLGALHGYSQNSVFFEHIKRNETLILMRTFSVFFLVLAFFAQNSLLAQVNSNRYDLMLRNLLARSVPEMSVSALSKSPGNYTLLDARETSETKVSGIEGALSVGYDAFQLQSVAHLDRNTPIVVYCSVGYRSEKVAEKLIAAGFTNVSNLYGGIFEWVNQGYSLVDSKGKPTRKVHAYSRAWSIWLTKGEKVY